MAKKKAVEKVLDDKIVKAIEASESIKDLEAAVGELKPKDKNLYAFHLSQKMDALIG